MKFGEKVKTLRLQKKMTQEELGKVMEVSTRTIINYEKGKLYPRKRESYAKLAGIFGVETNYILTEDEEFIAEASGKYGRRGQTQTEEILQQVSALFAGGDLSEHDRLIFVHEIQHLYFDSKKRAKEKYTPRKYRQTENTAIIG